MSAAQSPHSLIDVEERETLDLMKEGLQEHGEAYDAATHKHAIILKYRTLMEDLVPKQDGGPFEDAESRKAHLQLSAEIAVTVLLPQPMPQRVQNLRALLVRSLENKTIHAAFVLYRVPVGVLAATIVDDATPQWQRDVIWEWAVLEKVDAWVAMLAEQLKKHGDHLFATMKAYLIRVNAGTTPAAAASAVRSQLLELEAD